MEKTMSRHAIRTDRASTAARGTALSANSGMSAVKPLTGTDPRVSAFTGVAYVVNQETHPPRGHSPA